MGKKSNGSACITPDGPMSLRAAAKKYGIPLGTLVNRVFVQGLTGEALVSKENYKKTLLINYRGKQVSLGDIVPRDSLEYNRAIMRLRYGWPHDKLFDPPKGYRNVKRYYTAYGYESLGRLSRIMGIGYNTLNNRLIRKWPEDLVFNTPAYIQPGQGFIMDPEEYSARKLYHVQHAHRYAPI